MCLPSLAKERGNSKASSSTTILALAPSDAGHHFFFTLFFVFVVLVCQYKLHGMKSRSHFDSTSERAPRYARTSLLPERINLSEEQRGNNSCSQSVVGIANGGTRSNHANESVAHQYKRFYVYEKGGGGATTGIMGPRGRNDRTS